MKLIESRHPNTDAVIHVNSKDGTIAYYWKETGMMTMMNLFGNYTRWKAMVADAPKIFDLKAKFFEDHNIKVRVHKDLAIKEDEYAFKYTRSLENYFVLCAHKWKWDNENQSAYGVDDGEPGDLVERQFRTFMWLRVDCEPRHAFDFHWSSDASEPSYVYIMPFSAVPPALLDDIVIGDMCKEEVETRFRSVLEEERVKKSLEKAGLIAP